MGQIQSVYNRYSGAESGSVQQVQWGRYSQCTAGTVGQILSVYSTTGRVGLVVAVTAGTVGLIVSAYWGSEQHVQWGY